MKFSLGFAAGLLVHAAASTKTFPPRPNVKPFPHNAGRSMPVSPPRNTNSTCFVRSGSGANRDDGPAIYNSLQKCNNGGTIVLDDTYQISSPLDLTFLKHVDVVITGEVHFVDDVYLWAGQSFKHEFQNGSVYWRWGGKDVNIYGDLSNNRSVLDGHGQKFWAEGERNKTLRRPMLFSFDGMHGATMSHLRMRNSPQWFNIIANSTDILVSNMDIRAYSTDGTKIANSDGWDTYRSDRVVIQDSYIINTDDCVSFKPNSTNIVVQNMDCTGSHGMSVGSLGQYANKTDIIENLYIYNVSLANSSDGARIKVWPGIATTFQPTLNGGGGLGWVRNVTYDLFRNINNDRAITITQCYGSKNQTMCYENPSNLTIEDITIKNMYGYTSAKTDPKSGQIVCSAPDRCRNIRAENITVTVPSGNQTVYGCKNVDKSLLKIDCSGPIPGDRDTSQG